MTFTLNINNSDAKQRYSLDTKSRTTGNWAGHGELQFKWWKKIAQTKLL